MSRAYLTTCLLAAALAWSCQEQATEGGEDTAPVAAETEEPAAAEPAPGTPEAKIALAESGGPPEIARDAAILDVSAEEGVAPVELRAGSNGWTCIPDDPVAPGTDPMCLDGEWMKFIDAWMNKTEPQITAVGIGYMLQGGAVPSNTDPFATAPPEGQDWMRDGPHLMVITPDNSQLASLPTDPASGGPYVMWAGTPYAHVMVPVAATTE